MRRLGRVLDVVQDYMPSAWAQALANRIDRANDYSYKWIKRFYKHRKPSSLLVWDNHSDYRTLWRPRELEIFSPCKVEVGSNAYLTG